MNPKIKWRRWLLWLWLLTAGGFSRAQTLNLPPRPPTAPTGSQFINIILPMAQTDRENWVLAQIASGNVPGWLRNLVPITATVVISGTSHTVKYYVTPDYFAIGSDDDYFLEPMTPILAQRVATLLHCTVPTRLMVNNIWTNSAVKLTASTFSPGTYDISSVPVFVLENTAVMSQRDAVSNSFPLGALVSGDKKDIIISSLIYNSLQNGVPKPVVIYGWIQPNGVPIQPEFNGHAESYMDYSHGIRMAQMAIVVDGVSNTVTNILSDPVLWPLLSDEGAIAKPYYTVDNPLAPYFITQPFSQTVKPGANVTFNTSVLGDATLAYQWKLNGAPLTGTTNASLTITNAQAVNAGTYTVVVNNIYGTTTNMPAILQVNTNAFPLLFNDSLAADTSANWNFFSSPTGSSADYTVNWAYDYGAVPYRWNGATYLIPPAPNTTDGSTRGVKFTVNDSNGVDAAVNIYPRGQSFSNNFSLKFDMWINYPGGPNGLNATGTTEYAICGIDHLGTEINWAATNASATDGIWFGADGEGGSTRDYRAYVGNPSGVETDLMGGASGLVSVIHTSPVYEALFSASRFETVGAPGKNWVAAEVNQSNGVVTWKMNGTVIAQRANTSPFTTGDVMIGYMDIFPSIANPLADAFILFDNVRVEDWSSAPLQLPGINPSPPDQAVLSGTNVLFTVNPTGAQPFTYQWSFNGEAISGATNNSLALTAVQTTNSGNYSVTVSNVVGSVIGGPARLTVSTRPFQLGAATPLPNGNVQIIFSGAVGSQYVVQVSSDLMNWTSLTNLMDAANPVTFLDTNTTQSVTRFYRLATPQ